ncbi:MAG TPA: hypothetical protein VFR90_11315 [Methylibium sp.]|uniref:hypothetical protein n=1 Tax=Methylibium sp. TaxID=2067992 RepID=UPI002DBEFD28|nr:hypothetical protein [Methylibium sp.]HEU4459702.1 hypothetical protein [Methylibium sp.]
MQCKLCGMSRRLVKAHIVPKAFWVTMRDGAVAPVLATNTPGHFSRKAPIGVYDATILCVLCEAKFQAVDDYGVEVLLKRFNYYFTPIEEGGLVRAYESSKVDQMRLTRFVVAIAWRASVSSQPFFSKVSLCALEQSAGEVSTDPTIPVPSQFGVCLSRWRTSADNDGAADAMLDPVPEQIGGINCLRFYLGRTLAWLRIDALPFRPPLNRLELCSQPKAVVVARDFGKSRDLAAMVNVLRSGGAPAP